MRLFYITLLILGAMLFAPDFAFADTPPLPSECGVISDYNVVDVALTGSGEGTNGADFIFAGDDNSTPIDGGNGDDCIFIGGGNTASISGVNEKDIIIIGDNNSGQVSGDGENGEDSITVGDNNSGDVYGGNGSDFIVVGENNEGNIFGENGDDTLVVGKHNEGEIFGEEGDDSITLGCGNWGSVDENFETELCLLTAEPLPRTYSNIQHVSLSSEDSDSAVIYYTTDGVTPACSPDSENLYEYEYGSTIPIISTTTITAIGCYDDVPASGVTIFSYVIEELEVNTEDLSSLVEANLFVPTASDSAVTIVQNLKINVSADSGNSQIVLGKDTEIARIDGQALDVSELTSSQADVNTLAGFAEGTVFEAALQWGIPSVTLAFDPAITISIFVGADLNGQTLDVVRSVDGISEGSWTSEGIVAPATCLVSEGICSFQATKASYYATYTYTPPAPQPSNSGGGGGSLWFPALYNPVSTTTSVPEITSTPVVPALAPDPTPVATPLAVDVATVPKKTVRVAVVTKQPTPEPSPTVAPEQEPKPANKKLLSSILSIIAGFFRWPF